MADSTRHLSVEEVRAVFNSRLQPEPNSGCYLWDGCLYPKGYGGIRLNGKMQKTHRFAYEMANGPIPPGAHVLHRCDTRACCNPDHLFLGTNSDNIADKTRKDRGGKGLSTEKAKEIILMVKSGITHTVVASRFGVAQSTVSRICNGSRRPLASASVF